MMMKKTLIKNANIYCEGSATIFGCVLITDEKITQIEADSALVGQATPDTQVIDACGANLLPGFIDCHTHGCLGHCTMDADPDALLEIARYKATQGITLFYPTTMTDSRERILKAIHAVGEVRDERGDFARIGGVYLEGPYFNPVKAGAQSKEFIRRADIAELREFLNGDIVRVVAMAPEYTENLVAADFGKAEGVTLAAGHTDATYAQLATALDHGFSQITHLFNGMGAFGHREPGTIGGALTLDPFYTELICDNVHSHPAAQKLAWRAKGNEKIILITDSIRPSGLPDGTYHFGDAETYIVANNGTDLRIPSGNLAGSALHMDQALKNFCINTGASLEQSWRCTSLNAAISMGISDETGSLAVGKAADLVLLSPDFEVLWTMVEGNIVYQRG